MRNAKVLMMLVAIFICTPAAAYQFCDPVGQPDAWFTTGYATVGWITDAAIIRFEIRTADIDGGPTDVHSVEDVAVAPSGDRWVPATGGDWGQGLLWALKAHNDVLVTGEIEKAYVNFTGYWRMKVNAVPGTRIAVRAISTAEGATALPALPFMPDPTAPADNWPAAPVQDFDAAASWFAGDDYDCEVCGPGGTLGLIGSHRPARPPDWEGLLSDIPDNEEGRFIAFPVTIPTVSEWGLIVMALLFLMSGAVVIIRRRRVAA